LIPGIIGMRQVASLLAKLITVLADGFTSPNRMLATASAPRMPGTGFQHGAGLVNHGMDTGPPVSSTTMVCELAAATAATSASGCPQREAGTSRPSLWLIAEDDGDVRRLGQRSRRGRIVPGLYSTLACGALARTLSAVKKIPRRATPFRDGVEPHCLRRVHLCERRRIARGVGMRSDDGDGLNARRSTAMAAGILSRTPAPVVASLAARSGAARAEAGHGSAQECQRPIAVERRGH